jgi:hypothetical protein
MEQAVPDLTSPRVYQSPGGAWAHLSGLNQLFLGYPILSKIIVLTRLATAVQPARGIWTGSYLAHLSFDTRCTWHIRVSCNQTICFGCLCAPKMPPFATFSIICSRLAYGLNVPQTSTIFRLLAVIKSGLYYNHDNEASKCVCSSVRLKWTIYCRNMIISSFEVVECCKIRFTLGLLAGILS